MGTRRPHSETFAAETPPYHGLGIAANWIFRNSQKAESAGASPWITTCALRCGVLEGDGLACRRRLGCASCRTCACGRQRLSGFDRIHVAGGAHAAQHPLNTRRRFASSAPAPAPSTPTSCFVQPQAYSQSSLGRVGCHVLLWPQRLAPFSPSLPPSLLPD